MYLIIESNGTDRSPATELFEYPEAELAIAFGRSVRARLNLEISLDTIATSCGLSPADCMAAVRFAEGPDWLKFRAMVDDWPWPEIKRRVNLMQCDVPADEPSALVLAEPRGPDWTNLAQTVEPTAPSSPRLSAQEIRRRICHMTPGILAIALPILPHSHPLSWDSILQITVLALLLSAGVLVIYQSIARAGERHRLFNVLSYSMSVLCMLLLFPAHPELAAVVLAVLAFGDGGATLMGLLFGSHKLPWNPNKTWAGSAWFVLFAAPIAALAYWLEAQPAVPFAMALACGLTASLFAGLAESLPIGLSDNLRVGIAAGVGVLLAHTAITHWT